MQDLTAPDLKAVVFDWAGTVIDFGSCAPAFSFVEAFLSFGVKASVADARAPMGLPKRDHIAAMLAMPHLAEQWTQVQGAAPSAADIDRVYAHFIPLNERVVAQHATLIPGACEAIEALRDKGLKIGSTTGYTRSIMERVLPAAAAQGYSPDNCACADDLPEGRPGPLQMYQSFIDLRVYPPQSVVKVDDTVPGIQEGIAAGCMTVGVALSGNLVGKTFDELAALSDDEIDALRQHATRVLKEAGADHVIDTVADLPALLERLN